MPSDSGDPPLWAPERSGRTETRRYLLTLWRDDRAGPWRAALRAADGGPRLGFADLDQLAAYLLRLAEAEGTGQERGPPSR